MCPTVRTLRAPLPTHPKLNCTGIAQHTHLCALLHICSKSRCTHIWHPTAHTVPWRTHPTAGRCCAPLHTVCASFSPHRVHTPFPTSPTASTHLPHPPHAASHSPQIPDSSHIPHPSAPRHSPAGGGGKRRRRSGTGSRGRRRRGGGGSGRPRPPPRRPMPPRRLPWGARRQQPRRAGATMTSPAPPPSPAPTRLLAALPVAHSRGGPAFCAP